MPRVKQVAKSNYEFFQPNPSWKGKGKYRHEDCPIRAICAAEQLDWNTVYDLLCDCGKNVFDAPTSDDSIALCLKRLSYTKTSVKVTKGSKRPTVASFTKEHPEGTYVVRVAGHVVGIKDGKYFDCWDSGYKCIYTVYEKNPF